MASPIRWNRHRSIYFALLGFTCILLNLPSFLPIEIYWMTPANTTFESSPGQTLLALPQQDPKKIPAFSTTPPKIQFITIWSPTNAAPTYLANFFASVAANPSIDVLFIKYDKYSRGRQECEKVYAPANATNFLCKNWAGGCTTSERIKVAYRAATRSFNDRTNSYFCPFRGAIFKKWIHLGTSSGDGAILTSCLESTYSFLRVSTISDWYIRIFPWDVVGDFDVYLAGWHTGDEAVSMYMPGHMNIFSTEPKVVQEFMRFPNIQTLGEYLEEPFLESPAVEEDEYSYFLFWHSNLTFIRFDCMVEGQYHLSSPGLGVSPIQDEWKFNISNTDAGHVQDVVNARLLIDSALDLNARNHVGFTKQFSIHYQTEWVKMFWQGGRRLVYRRQTGGPVVERREPANNAVIVPTSLDANVHHVKEHRPILREMLYAHFRQEKYTPWWKDLPYKAMQGGEVLFIHTTMGAFQWDREGRLLWQTKLR
ncbi:hypothetical protein C8J56DRAFT_1043437 [Mycena floridula]|nr:hypothetical protein C8J56DRAFT_1043437 [Mycena floridula]